MILKTKLNEGSLFLIIKIVTRRGIILKIALTKNFWPSMTHFERTRGIF